MQCGWDEFKSGGRTNVGASVRAAAILYFPPFVEHSTIFTSFSCELGEIYPVCVDLSPNWSTFGYNTTLGVPGEGSFKRVRWIYVENLRWIARRIQAQESDSAK